MEHRSQQLLTRHQFLWRLGKYACIAAVLALISLVGGMLGYRFLEGQSWPDAFVNAAMLLAAMGPLAEPQTDAGKVFAGCYALYCGLVFLFITGLLVTPIAHRLLHLFHADPGDSDE